MAKMSVELERAWKKALDLVEKIDLSESEADWIQVPSSTGGFYMTLVLFDGKKLAKAQCGCQSYADGNIVREGVTVCKHVLAAAYKVVQSEVTDCWQTTQHKLPADLPEWLKALVVPTS